MIWFWTMCGVANVALALINNNLPAWAYALLGFIYGGNLGMQLMQRKKGAGRG